MRAVGISTLSARCRDIEKPGALQRALRTAAMASLKEGWRLQYHAADLGLGVFHTPAAYFFYDNAIIHIGFAGPHAGLEHICVQFEQAELLSDGGGLVEHQMAILEGLLGAAFRREIAAHHLRPLGFHHLRIEIARSAWSSDVCSSDLTAAAWSSIRWQSLRVCLARPSGEKSPRTIFGPLVSIT